MTLTIDLTPDTEARLRRLAKERGVDVNTFALDALTELARRCEGVDNEEFERVARELVKENAELLRRLA